jgi:glucose-6-phosphate isomerase
MPADPAERTAARLGGRLQVAPATLAEALDRSAAALERDRFVERLWRKAPDLWSADPAEQRRIADRLGWLESVEAVVEALPRLGRLADQVRRDGITHAVLLGMGGSSLAPEVLRAILGVQPGAPAFRMLDSTDPAAIRAAEAAVALPTTLFLIASKSGTTIEPKALWAYFRGRLAAAGVASPARHAIAITDEGTPLCELGRREGYREVFVNPADIGGRYSALSFFGMVPAALMGLDVAGLLHWGRGMARLCGPGRAVRDNPGVALGLVMGAAAQQGRDKLTLVADPALEPFGLWIEQLIAESTGKRGTGIVPIAGEPLGPPAAYGADRLFVRLRLEADPREAARDAPVESLRAAGHPLVTIDLPEPAALAAEFFRWEVATATAGAVLGINPFDEPNVQQAKDATGALLDRFAAERALPTPSPHLVADAFALTFDRASWERIGGARPTPAAAAAGFLGLAKPGDYFGLLAYLPFDPPLADRLAALRRALRDRTGAATMFGYGPRYLHSTGQLHKGGPNRGLFIVVTASPREDVAIPGQAFSFGTLETAQALGDFASLEQAGRRVARVHLAAPELAALDQACRWLESALP